MNKLRLLISMPILLIAFYNPAFGQKDKKVPDILKPANGDSATFNLLFRKQLPRKTTAAVSEIYTPELVKTVSTSYGGLLTGRFAGLYTTQPTGEPGNDDVSVFVRGQAPFVLIDGTRQSFISINPEQIESVTILKDAISTAMLGMRGGNNAILITTKKACGMGKKLSLPLITVCKRLPSNQSFCILSIMPTCIMKRWQTKAKHLLIPKQIWLHIKMQLTLLDILMWIGRRKY